MMAAAERASQKRNPFQSFATLTLAALAGWHSDKPYCQEVARPLAWTSDSTWAHSALYDTERTAVPFCEIVNRWKRLGGWPLPAAEEV